MANLTKCLRQQIRKDKNHFIEQVALQAAHDPQNIYKILRKAGVSSQRRRRYNRLPGLQHPDGRPCENQHELATVWLDHFAQIEGGHHVSAQRLLQLCAVDEIYNHKWNIQSWSELPTLKDLEDGFRKCQPHKAAGPDQIVPELCRKAAKWWARWMYSLMAKITIYQSEPIAHKGGILHAIWKRKDSTQDPNAYRGILVSSQISKVFHNLSFRQRAMPAYMAAADPLQCGGLRGRSVIQAAQACRLHQSICHQQKYSTGVLFVDIRSAYYRLLRELSIRTHLTKDDLAFILQRLQIKDIDLVELYDQITMRPSAAEEIAMAPVAHDMAACFHSHTWFQVKSDPRLVRTMRGTRPGDGWADLLFNVVVANLLTTLRSELTEIGCNFEVQWNNQKGIYAGPGIETTDTAFAVAWANDLAFMFWNDKANGLLEMLQMASAHIIKRFGHWGLDFNYGKGKTKILVHLKGPGSTPLRRTLFAMQDPHLDIEGEHEVIPLSLVPQYVHLGGILQAKGRMGPELRRRLARGILGIIHSLAVSCAKVLTNSIKGCWLCPCTCVW